MKKRKKIELRLHLFILLVAFSLIGLFFAVTVFGAVYKVFKYKKARVTTISDGDQIFQNSLDCSLIPNSVFDLIKKDHEILYADIISQFFVNWNHPSDSRIVLIINPIDDSLILFYDYIFGCEICPSFTLVRANISYDNRGILPQLNSIIQRELSWQEYLTFNDSEGGEISSEK